MKVYDMTTDDITHEQKMRIQRALLKQRRKVDNNKTVCVVFVVIALLIVAV